MAKKFVINEQLDTLNQQLSVINETLTRGNEIAEFGEITSKFDGTVKTYNRIMREWFDLQAGTPKTLTTLLNEWYEHTRTGWSGWTTFSQPSTSLVSEGTKGGDNADMVCVPSTDAAAGQDDYAGLPLFAVTHVNWELDAETGKKIITAIKGISPNYEQHNPEKFVGVTQQTGYVWTAEDATTYTMGYGDNASIHANAHPLPEAVEPDGTVNNFVLHAKYMTGNADGKMTCCAGVKTRAFISHNMLITLPDNIGTMYSGGTCVDWAFLKIMTRIKYASMTQDSKIQGCVNYNYQHYAQVAEEGVKRVILTAADGAHIREGSTVLLGNYAGNLDRGQAAIRSISGDYGVKVISVETVEIDGTEYKAVYVDIDEEFDTVANGNAATGTTVLSTWHWMTGTNDNVLGNDGSIVSASNGVYPALLQGIEYAVGGYEVIADVIMQIADGAYRPYIARAASHQATAINEHMIASDLTCAQPASDGWRYIVTDGYDGETFFPAVVSGGSSSTRTRDAFYMNGTATATGAREMLAFGNLSTGATNGGLSVLAGINALATATWYFLARLSPNGNRGELAA